MSFVAIITSVISASYYLRIVVLLVNETINNTQKSTLLPNTANDDSVTLNNLNIETDATCVTLANLATATLPSGSASENILHLKD
jgi:NADH:ubiquinone oxidoreductase subunit 2 (subunit N)